MNNILQFALKYAELGWYVLPILPRQKIPASAHGVLDATIDVEQITKWFNENPSWNIAVACGPESGIFVIDIDVAESGEKNGWESLKEFPPLPDTVRQDTPRGGAHFFYRTDDSPANRINFRPAIDIRSTKTYVLVPPSIHPNNGQYSWTPGMDPWTIQCSSYPDFMRPTTRAPWAGDFLPRQQPTGPVVAANADILQRASLYLAECEAAVQGCGGHDKLLWAAVAMIHGFLLSDDQTFDLLAREYNPRCVPPWDLSMTKDGRDFRRKVTEARKLVPDKPRGWLLEDDSYTPMPIDPAQMAAVKQLIEDSHAGNFPVLTSTPIGANPYKEAFELEFLTHPTGLLGEICEWINRTAIRKQPILTLACTLTFCGVLFGRKIRDSLGSRTNLYCMGIAKSSAGKAHAPSQIRRLCEAAGCRELLGGDDAASDTSIEERIERSPACLFLWDEIGFLLSHIRSGISQHHARIVPLLMKLYSAAGSIFKGKEYADSEHQRTIVQPCLGIYGTSSPERFCEGISPTEMQDGWLSRCMVFITNTKPTKDRKNCDAPIPQGIVDQVGGWYGRQIGETDGKDIGQFAVYHGTAGASYEQPPQQIVVPTIPEANDVLVAFDNECTKFGKSNPLLDCLWSKGEENARRIALIVAASESFDNPQITVPIANYACRLVRYLLLSFGKEIAPAIVTGQIDSKKQKLLGIIKKYGAGGCQKRDLTRGSQWTNTKERGALLADLIEAEEIVAQSKGKTVFFWTLGHYRTYLGTQ